MNNMDNYLDEQNINKNPNGNLEKLYNSMINAYVHPAEKTDPPRRSCQV